MARLETRNRPASQTEDSDEEHLDDWFARRLDRQGIPRRPGAPPMSRVLAVAGLALALGAFLWALSVVGPHKSSSAATTSPPPSSSTGGNGGTGGSTAFKTGKNAWKTVTVDVLNGFGGNGAAASAQSELQAKGWKTGATGNATGITKTEIVYLPGFKRQARVVAKKMSLLPALAVAQVPGVSPSSTNGVALVLGPNQLTGVTF
jgi:hypothetical protein